MAIRQSDKTRQERLLQNTKGYKPLIGRGEPRMNEGANGDMRINMTNFGLRLYVKFNNQWFGSNLYPLNGRESQIIKLKDATGGTVSDSLVDVPASYTEATLANQLASLSAKINEILDRIG